LAEDFFKIFGKAKLMREINDLLRGTAGEAFDSKNLIVAKLQLYAKKGKELY
jgi:hypothetical protein